MPIDPNRFYLRHNVKLVGEVRATTTIPARVTQQRQTRPTTTPHPLRGN